MFAYTMKPAINICIVRNLFICPPCNLCIGLMLLMGSHQQPTNEGSALPNGSLCWDFIGYEDNDCTVIGGWSCRVIHHVRVGTAQYCTQYAFRC